MPNVYAPSGIQISRPYDGRAPNFGAPSAVILSTYATRINAGDPVFLATDGTIRLYVAGGTTIHGIFNGCRYFDPVQQKTMFNMVWPGVSLGAGQYVEAYVDQDPMVTFRAQVNGGPAVLANIGLNADIVAGSSGQVTANNRSICGISPTFANTATLPFRVVGIIGYPGPSVSPGGPFVGYDATQANNWVEFTLNTSDITTRTGQA
jgi:hypothetical protein